MSFNWAQAFEDFVTMWVVIDPIGSIPVFIAVTMALTAKERVAAAIKAIVVSAAILVGFVVIGQLLLEALRIPLTSFQIAGGVVLFLFALTMIFGPSKPEKESKEASGSAADVAVFPLAVPSIASPGAMLAAVVLTDNHRFSLAEQATTSGLMLLILAVTLLLLLAANPIHRLIGTSGASIVSRVMGLILASVAVNNVLEALAAYFGLSLPAL